MILSATWRRSWIPTNALWTPNIRWCVWTKSLRLCTRKCGLLCPPRPGQPGRQDYEYRRMGTANLFMITAPFGGWRHVEVTARRTKLDFAQILKDLVDVHFPQAPRITLVCDNLNTHKPAVLYERFQAATARRIARRLEWVHTPKHASWLNMAEIEINVLKRQALARRIPDTDTLRSQVTAWSELRNALGAPVNWRFTTDDARVKLQSLYPPV